MSPSHADSTTADMLRDGNYFYWEFNARMKLAKKNLLDHIDATKTPARTTRVRRNGRSTI